VRDALDARARQCAPEELDLRDARVAVASGHVENCAVVLDDPEPAVG
jgi:hypothetical protein